MICPATLLQKDDRWGGFVLHCERPASHPGEHQHAMTGCEPVAILTWRGTYEKPVNEVGWGMPCSRCLDEPCSCGPARTARGDQ